ncbi:hypothetical protein HID58_048218, partial [Brassica napus]
RMIETGAETMIWEDTRLPVQLHNTNILLIQTFVYTTISTFIGKRDLMSITKINLSKTSRGGYDIAVEQRRSRTAEPLLEPSIKALKQKVWKLKTSRKIKHFL